MADFTEQKRDVVARTLRRNVEGEVRFDATTRRLYSTDASIYQVEPLGVVLPKTVADVVATVQVAAETGTPLTARGGGTSLSGQAIGPGVVLDCSKYLNTICDLDPAAREARVGPGVILDQLNRAASGHGLQFGPEVATANRANLGGMIGNNSAGARSIVYGKTINHVRSLEVVLSDGSRATFGPVAAAEWDRRTELRTLEGTIYRHVRRLVGQNADEIRQRFPRILRRVSGYNLDAIAEAFNGGVAEYRVPSTEYAVSNKQHSVRSTADSVFRTPGLHHLVIGSEGTLAVVTGAELDLIPRPQARALLVPHFATLAAAMDALAVCLEFQPSAVELLDRLLIDLARNNLALKDHMAAVQGRPAALLMVEFSGDSEAEVADRVEKLRQRLHEVNGVTALVPALDAAARDPLWNLRTASMPLLYGLPGDRKPVTFVEDTAVAPQRLPEFVARFRDILARHGTDGAFYGHASVGCLHIRPLLDLKDPADVTRMRCISADVTDLVLEFNGALSGEHGDGMVRSEWNRKMFGDAVYEAFRAVKHAFDPHGLLNPGKVVDAAPMTDNLRYGNGYTPAEPATVFRYDKQEGFVRAVEMCNGAGVCRKLHGGTMCPSFRATRDEKDSTRGRANVLRLALADERPLHELRSRQVYDVLDLCLMCKACKAECPSNVDLAKLKAEFLHFYYQGHPRPPGHRLLAHVHLLNRLGARVAPLINRLQQSRLARWLLEKAAGIDRRRSLPPLHAEHFRRWFFARKGVRSQESGDRSQGTGVRDRVLLLDDCFTTYNEPEIGKAAVRVLEAAGYEVELVNMVCCGRALLSKGFLPEAKELVQRQVSELARRVADGTPLLGLEPSCLLTLADDWPELMPGSDSRRVASAARLAEVWLAEQVAAGRCTLPLAPRTEKCLLHGHCHQKALCGTSGTAAALRLIPELDVTVLDTGCCGMAGSFGYEKEHYDLSAQIANLELLPALAQQPAAIVAAPGTSCRHQIRDLANRRARHPLEVLAEQVDEASRRREPAG